ncbi:hypothetical protein [Devosia aurantiaca]|uniref:XRE family transcriptional regulator n=1 Tax=Devosia aurantiaca TaxID=2714858 RepID=A0A6M1SHM1_9HYPH|nr:hypothetical protein [Devosia aurantiaca]NGP19309.1 hypothetical protein [Devosia aurantiaca]
MVKVCRLNQAVADELGTMTGPEFKGAMKELNATLDQMAKLLGIGRRMVAAYRSDHPIPPHIALATRQLRSLLE